MKPINIKEWIDDHRDLLKPPVGNKMVWTERDFIVMVVGGPNGRQDFHINEGEEFFYQLEGNMVVKIVNDDGKIEDVPINEGEIFLLPKKVPHSPIRPANTIGLVIEMKRGPKENDGLAWFCSECDSKLYEEYFPLTNIEKDFHAVFERYYSDEKNMTCKKCGHFNAKN
jgi:3-hydroxyanthranilate 3,4-dioxygenase